MSVLLLCVACFLFFFQAEDGIRDLTVTGVQTCALPISLRAGVAAERENHTAFVLVQYANRGDQQKQNDDGGYDQVHGKDRKSTRLNSSHSQISYAVFCLKKKKKNKYNINRKRQRTKISL